MADMHISLFSAAAAALIAIWLGIRCVRVRVAEKILHGDGGNSLMMKRMRAQANFGEYAPFALALIILLDLVDAHVWGLGLAAFAFMLGRVLHAIGMDADQPHWARMVGMILTIPVMIGLSLWAILIGAKLV